MSDLFGNHIVGFPTRWLKYALKKARVQFRMQSVKLDGTGHVIRVPGPSCSKLTTSLVNVSLKFQTLILQIHCYFFNKK